MASNWEKYTIYFVNEYNNSFSYENLVVNLNYTPANGFSDLCELIRQHRPSVNFPSNALFHFEYDGTSRKSYDINNAEEFRRFRQNHKVKDLYVRSFQHFDRNNRESIAVDNVQTGKNPNLVCLNMDEVGVQTTATTSNIAEAKEPEFSHLAALLKSAFEQAKKYKNVSLNGEEKDSPKSSDISDDGKSEAETVNISSVQSESSASEESKNGSLEIDSPKSDASDYGSDADISSAAKPEEASAKTTSTFVDQSKGSATDESKSTDPQLSTESEAPNRVLQFSDLSSLLDTHMQSENNRTTALKKEQEQLREVQRQEEESRCESNVDTPNFVSSKDRNIAKYERFIKLYKEFGHRYEEHKKKIDEIAKAKEPSLNENGTQKNEVAQEEEMDNGPQQQDDPKADDTLAEMIQDICQEEKPIELEPETRETTTPMHSNPLVHAALLTLAGMGLKTDGEMVEFLELVDGDISSALELVPIPK